MKEVNVLLKRLVELEDAPLIWVNKKVYDMQKENERLNNIIKEVRKYIFDLPNDEYIGYHKIDIFHILDKEKE